MTADELDALTTTVPPPEAGRRIGKTVGSLANMRVAGTGPRFVKIGRSVRYRLSDLAEYLDAQTRTSTSDPGRGGDS